MSGVLSPSIGHIITPDARVRNSLTTMKITVIVQDKENPSGMGGSNGENKGACPLTQRSRSIASPRKKRNFCWMYWTSRTKCWFYVQKCLFKHMTDKIFSDWPPPPFGDPAPRYRCSQAAFKPDARTAPRRASLHDVDQRESPVVHGSKLHDVRNDWITTLCL